MKTQYKYNHKTHELEGYLTIANKKTLSTVELKFDPKTVGNWYPFALNYNIYFRLGGQMFIYMDKDYVVDYQYPAYGLTKKGNSKNDDAGFYMQEPKAWSIKNVVKDNAELLTIVQDLGLPDWTLEPGNDYDEEDISTAINYVSTLMDQELQESYLSAHLSKMLPKGPSNEGVLALFDLILNPEDSSELKLDGKIAGNYVSKPQFTEAQAENLATYSALYTMLQELRKQVRALG